MPQRVFSTSLSPVTSTARALAVPLALFLGACSSGGGSGPALVPTNAALAFDDGSPFEIEGAKVFVDDQFVGLTDATGHLPVSVPLFGFVRVLVGNSLQGEVELDGFVPDPAIHPAASCTASCGRISRPSWRAARTSTGIGVCLATWRRSCVPPSPAET